MQLAQFSRLVSERAESKTQAAKIQHSKPCAWNPLPHSSPGCLPGHGSAPNWRHFSTCDLTGAEYSWPLIYFNDATM